MDSNQALEHIFKALHLTAQDSRIYKILSEKGPLTLFVLAKETKIPRTSLYRMVDGLIQRGILREHIDNKVKKASAVDLPTLERILNEEKLQLIQAEQIIPALKDLLVQEANNSMQDTKVLFYKGVENIKQQLWHELHSEEKILRCFGYEVLEDGFGSTFAQRFRQERIRRGVIEKDLISSDDPYLTEESFKIIRTHPQFQGYECKYLPQEKVKIDHQMTIYDDVIAFYDWNAKEPFGVEIYSRTIAAVQKQLFDILWAMALTPETVLEQRRQNNDEKK